MEKLRENVDRKLVELVKPHEILYNGINSGSDNMEIRTKLWNEICTELNTLFNDDKFPEEYKTRWLALRTSYRQGLTTKMNRRSNVCDDMGFLRPFTHVTAKVGRKNYRRSVKHEKNSTKKKVKPKPAKKTKHHPLQLHTNGMKYEANSPTHTVPNYRTIKKEALETNDGCFEIILPDDDEAALNDELSVNSLRTANTQDRVPFDDELEDSDGAFGLLVTRELREMAPAAKREIKRTITQLLYS